MSDETTDVDERCAEGDHSQCDPDVCMTAKLKYWREQKRSPVVVPDSFKAVRK